MKTDSAKGVGEQPKPEATSAPLPATLQEAVAELLPCPFCGEVPLLDHASLTGRNHYWWASCRNQRCTVLPSGMQCLTERDARKAWNTRSPSLSAYIEREKRMADALEKIANMPPSLSVQVLVDQFVDMRVLARAALSPPGGPRGES